MHEPTTEQNFWKSERRIKWKQTFGRFNKIPAFFLGVITTAPISALFRVLLGKANKFLRPLKTPHSSHDLVPSAKRHPKFQEKNMALTTQNPQTIGHWLEWRNSTIAGPRAQFLTHVNAKMKIQNHIHLKDFKFYFPFLVPQLSFSLTSSRNQKKKMHLPPNHSKNKILKPQNWTELNRTEQKCNTTPSLPTEQNNKTLP